MLVILSRLIGESKGVGIDEGTDGEDIGDRDGDSDNCDGDVEDVTGGSDELRSQLSGSFLLWIPLLFSVPNPTSLIM